MKYREIKGDLIELSRTGIFDVVTHGCNCQCKMGKGIAPKMAKEFGCDKFKMEEEKPGNHNKLGQIDYKKLYWEDEKHWTPYPDEGGKWATHSLYVVNSYTQFYYDAKLKPLDYEALTLCLRKINYQFAGKRIGLPGLIGCGLAGGDSERVKEIIKRELIDCDVTVVYLPKIG